VTGINLLFFVFITGFNDSERLVSFAHFMIL